MNGFKIFIETEEEDNVQDTISKLPKSHQKLLDRYKFKFTPGNTLKGDNDHIGYIHNDKIVVAAPYRYSREMVTCHEIAHLVFEYLMTRKLRQEWSELMKKTKKDHQKIQHAQNKPGLDQNDEEIFAMAYAATYARHAPETYANKEWQHFIKNIP